MLRLTLLYARLLFAKSPPSIFFHHITTGKEWTSLRSKNPVDLRITIATDQMVINEPGRLHMGIDDGRTDKFEPARFEVLADVVGERGFGGHLLEAAETIANGLPAHESPDITVE